MQELNPRNFVAWENAREAVVVMPNHIFIFFSDETRFHLSQSVNKQNLR